MIWTKKSSILFHHDLLFGASMPYLPENAILTKMLQPAPVLSHVHGVYWLLVVIILVMIIAQTLAILLKE